MKTRWFVMPLALMLAAVPAMAQSSSLYVVDPTAPPAPVAPVVPGEPVSAAPVRGEASRLSPVIAATSFSAVQMPEPRRFAVHDLVTIIIRESTQTDFESTLETEKESSVEGEISDFPRISLHDLLNAQLRPNDFENGKPKLGVELESEFTGEGEYSRKESITGRITARVVDVKPNGTLVLEARKYIQSDDETLDIVLTGQVRAEDVSIDNTVLSTQLYDLRLDKQHTGELRKSSKKGLITRVLETIFNF